MLGIQEFLQSGPVRKRQKSQQREVGDDARSPLVYNTGILKQTRVESNEASNLKG